jgi:hypothetical protein
MGYAKLFSSIVHSTIWREAPHVKVVWITMLALADRTGVVEASLPGLADAAKVRIEECQDAIAKLSAPDEFSRTKDYEGRRIEEIEGGWLILNYEKHRAKKDMDEVRDAARVRAKTYRTKQRARAEAAGTYPRSGDSCPCCSEPFKEPFRLYVAFDHDHETGLGRAYICQSCNKLVGQAENGKEVNPQAAEYVQAYLARFSVSSREVTFVTPESHGITLPAKPAPAPAPDAGSSLILPSTTMEEGARLVPIATDRHGHPLTLEGLGNEVDAVKIVFDYWRLKTGHTKAVWNETRKKHLLARLREEPGTLRQKVQGLELAVDGALADPLFNGSKEGTAYTGFENIFIHKGRNRIEKLQAAALGEDAPMPGARRPDDLESNNRRAIEEAIRIDRAKKGLPSG